jgi:hypothetical protein
MKALEKFVQRESAWAVAFGGKPFDLDDANDRVKIARRIDAMASPESLTMDGELSRSQVQQRYNELVRVADQLRRLDPTITFSEV